MTHASNTQVFSRSIATIAAIIIIASGVTYAALQSQQVKLTGNSIETATANLQISSDGSSFGSSQQGWLFNNIIPGGSPSPIDGRSIWLRNNGGTPLNLKLAVSSIPDNPDAVDLSKVKVILTPIGGGGGSSQTYTLKSLVDSNLTGGISLVSPAQLYVGNTQLFTLKIAMDIDAISSPSARLGNIEFSFSGQAVVSS